MNTRERELRNVAAREGVEFINKECGLRWNFIASQIGLSYHSFVNWRKSRYDFAEDRLKSIENLIVKYNGLY